MAINQRVWVWTDVTHQHKTMHMHWHTTSPSFPPISFLLCTQHSIFFLSPLLPPSLSPFSLFCAPLKLCLPTLPLLSLFLSPSFVCALTLHLSSIHIAACTHTDRCSALSRYARSCHFTPSPIHINCPQWAISYPSISRHPPPPPFSAFGITILSESFIYPLSSSIPLPIISASLPSMTHSPVRPIHLPALFFFSHHRCLLCQPISPSSVLLPPLSLLISYCHH